MVVNVYERTTTGSCGSIQVPTTEGHVLSVLSGGLNLVCHSGSTYLKSSTGALTELASEFPTWWRDRRSAEYYDDPANRFPGDGPPFIPGEET